MLCFGSKRNKLAQQLEGIAELEQNAHSTGKTWSGSQWEKRESRYEIAGGGEIHGSSPGPKLHRILLSCLFCSMETEVRTFSLGWGSLFPQPCSPGFHLYPYVLNHNFQFFSSVSSFDDELLSCGSHLLLIWASPVPSSGSGTVNKDYWTQLYSPSWPVCSISWSSQ